MIDIVDSVGGIDIDVQEDEMPYICGYVQEIMKVTDEVSHLDIEHERFLGILHIECVE